MALSLAAGRPGSSLAGGLLSARAQWKCGSAFAQLAWDQDQWKEITDWGLLGRASPIATAPPPRRHPYPLTTFMLLGRRGRRGPGRPAPHPHAFTPGSDRRVGVGWPVRKGRPCTVLGLLLPQRQLD